jgi:hypothetical protein
LFLLNLRSTIHTLDIDLRNVVQEFEAIEHLSEAYAATAAVTPGDEALLLPSFCASALDNAEGTRNAWVLTIRTYFVPRVEESSTREHPNINIYAQMASDISLALKAVVSLAASSSALIECFSASRTVIAWPFERGTPTHASAFETASSAAARASFFLRHVPHDLSVASDFVRAVAASGGGEVVSFLTKRVSVDLLFSCATESDPIFCSPAVFEDTTLSNASSGVDCPCGFLIKKFKPSFDCKATSPNSPPSFPLTPPPVYFDAAASIAARGITSAIRPVKFLTTSRLFQAVVVTIKIRSIPLHDLAAANRVARLVAELSGPAADATRMANNNLRLRSTGGIDYFLAALHVDPNEFTAQVVFAVNGVADYATLRDVGTCYVFRVGGLESLYIFLSFCLLIIPEHPHASQSSQRLGYLCQSHLSSSHHLAIPPPPSVSHSILANQCLSGFESPPQWDREFSSSRFCL